MQTPQDLKAQIAQRESEVAERAAVMATLRKSLADVEADLARLAALQAGVIEDVPSEELVDYLESMRNLESDGASLRRVRKEVKRRLNVESTAHMLAERDLARKYALLAAIDHKDDVLDTLRAAKVALDSLFEDRVARSGPNHAVSTLLGLRRSVAEAIKVVEESW